MAVYVDCIAIRWRGDLWYHLVADSLEELHQFAAKIGLKREWYQYHKSKYPHYDVNESRRVKAILNVAKPVSVREALQIAKKLREEELRKGRRST